LTDEIRLTLPRDREFFRIAHLVVGGLAVRLDLTLENLEDLQLAIAGLLDEHDVAEAVTIAVRVEGDCITTRIGPIDGERLRAELGRGEEMGLARVLATVTDSVQVEGDEVELVKNVERAGRP
jgi:anti-sigma regulatory factor (Ser/Thr protein kinase)